MRFLLHGAVNPEAGAALAKLGHSGHTLLEISGEMNAAETEAGPVAADDPRVLLPILEKRQWNLLTVDTAFVRLVYEHKVRFNGAIVMLLDDADDLKDQGPAVERLFERYKRLTPGRLYTITRSRVKIRQLPGAGQDLN